MAHRDLKPQNVVLRDGNPAQPVIVDFGLSFIDDDQDLTQTNEAVGNRFLNLPELVHGGRNPASDVTQLAGVVFYLLTGLYPLSLDDGAGNRPHQTAEGRERLAQVLEPDQLLRLLSLFDRAFRPVVTDRYATVDDLLADLHRVTTQSAEPIGYEAMKAAALERWHAAGGATIDSVREALQTPRRRLSEIIIEVARDNGVGSSQTRADESPTSDPPSFSKDYGLARPGEEPQFRRYRFELRGPDDWVLVIDDVELWRGGNLADPALYEMIAVEAIRHLA